MKSEMLSDITDILDAYFDNYSFDPTKVGHDYNEETAEFIETALGFGMGAGKFEFVRATAMDSLTIEVIITDEYVPEPYDDFGPVPDILVRAKLDGDKVKFKYCGFIGNMK